MKRIITVFLSFCLLFQFIFVPVSAENNIAFTINIQENSDKLTLTVSLSGEVKNVGGLDFTLDYDEIDFNYVSGSRTLLLSGVKSADVNKDTSVNGAVPFAVDCSDAFTVSGDIVSYQFDVLGNDVGDKEFILTVNEFYYLDNNLSSITLAENSVSAIVSLSNASVKTVKELINAIGAITLQSESAIVAARNAYNALGVQQKRQVTNLSVLTTAEAELKRLKNEAVNKEYLKQAEAFRKAHNKILSKTVEKLTLKDKESLNVALEAYTALNINVQVALNSEKNLLNRLKTRINELEKIAQNDLEEAQLKKEAKEMAAAFKKQWKSYLELTVDKVTDQYLTPLAQALGSADSNALMNSYFMEYIKEEYAHLTTLKETAENYVDPTISPDELAANKFLSSYGFLLYMSPEDVTSDVEVDIRVAVASFNLLSEEAKKILGSEVKEKLDALLIALDELPEEDSENTKTEVIYKEVLLDSEPDEKSALVNVVTKGMSSAVWWLLATLLTTILLCAATAALLIYLKKKEQNIVSEEENE